MRARERKRAAVALPDGTRKQYGVALTLPSPGVAAGATTLQFCCWRALAAAWMRRCSATSQRRSQPACGSPPLRVRVLSSR